ncbi:hypothetical protein [Nocardia terpenica]|uniref:Cupin n=1 Tax=Nocardia terpenica TaxID=455432 RepID=A0A164I3K1_9NOCA|nr:hypothetical protein [Nocardia terpenica]KZM69070.1 hypothetical protein AWN90_15140 [Nocardia terpenica]NQE87828.1 hypothetical protein [Nocardia terpenica]
MPDESRTGDGDFDRDGATVLLDRDGIRCWLERVPPDTSGLPRGGHPAISIVISGGPVELLDDRDRTIRRGTLLSGQMIYDCLREPSVRHRLHNLSDRPLLLMTIALPN